MRFFQTNKDFTLTVLRLVLGIVFFAHGAQKVLGWFGGSGYTGTLQMFRTMGFPQALSMLAMAAEFLGGLGLIVGLLGRVASFGIMCNMVVAIAKVHAANGLFMNWTGTQAGEGFEYHLLVLAIGFVILIKGSGAYSLDWLIARPRYPRVTGFTASRAA